VHGILSCVLFAVYIDVLVYRLKSADIDCKMFDINYGCLLGLYEDDRPIVSLAHTVNGMQQMLNIYTEFGVDYDVKFNDIKSVA